MTPRIHNAREGDNQPVTPAEVEQIRNLDDFDMEMLISEIQDHGWLVARRTLAMMQEAATRRP